MSENSILAAVKPRPILERHGLAATDEAYILNIEKMTGVIVTLAILGVSTKEARTLLRALADVCDEVVFFKEATTAPTSGSVN